MGRGWESIWGPRHLLTCRVCPRWGGGAGGRHTSHPCSPPYAHQHCRRCDITLLDHSTPAAPPGSEGARVSARLCCRAQHHADSSARVLRKRCFGELVWAWAFLMAEPAPPHPKHSPHGVLTSPATHETQHVLPGAAASHGVASPLLYLAWPAREKKKKTSGGGQGYVMGSVLTRKEQAWLPGV